MTGKTEAAEYGKKGTLIFMHQVQKMLCKAARILRSDPVLAAALCAAAVSSFLVPPTAAYFGYLDLRVLSLLLALMLTVAGLKETGVFNFLTERLLRLADNTRALAAVLLGLCFFGSMLMTNDVSLLTFVPFAVLTLTQAGKRELILPVTVLQTVAANLGSMLTPVGNPQNLYLYSYFGMTPGSFFAVTAMPSAVSLAMLAAAVLFFRKEPVAPDGTEPAAAPVSGRAVPWLVLFGICLAAVFRVIPYWAAIAAAAAWAAVSDWKLLLRADYGLLLTFVFLFVFIGNMKSLPAVRGALGGIVAGRELAAGILLSQVVSNVPAAMLLSGFTENGAALLVGVNLGGLGTLIASMASVISFKQYAALPGARKGRYLAVFTAVNVLFLAVLWGAELIFPPGGTTA